MASFERFASAVSRLEHKVNVTAGNILCDGRNAFPITDTIEFSINAPSNTVSAQMIILTDSNKCISRFDLQKVDDKYTIRIPMDSLSGTGLYFYKYHISTSHGDFDIVRDDTNFSDKIAYSNGDFTFSFQLMVYKRRKEYPDWMRGGIMYQIMPDRFNKGGNNPKKDYAIMQNPGEIPMFSEVGVPILNNNFFGGDLKGIENKLDYLQSLGVNILYLNPIFDAYSNHKYDTGDYEHVDIMFGGDEALLSLIEACNKRNMHIILDGVFNHTGSDSKYFNKYCRYDSVGAYNSVDSEYHDWYNFESFPDKYESWWGIDILPRVRSNNSKYINYICGENGIIRKYLKAGISGWRLDVADEVSDFFLENLKDAALTEKSDAVIIGEVWEDASTKVSYGSRRMYFEGSELDSVMNYPVMKAIISYLRDGEFINLIKTLKGIYGNYPKENCDLLMNFLGTHDTERVLTALAGVSSEGKKKAELCDLSLSEDELSLGLKLLKLAYVMISTLPGVPCIYYGDEVQMEGYGDPFCRKYYPWGKENTDLLDYYTTIGKIRRNNIIFVDGELEVIFADVDIACYERRGDTYTIVTIINRSNVEYKIESANAFDLISDTEISEKVILPYSATLLKIRNEDTYLVSEIVKNQE